MWKRSAAMALVSGLIASAAMAQSNLREAAKLEDQEVWRSASYPPATLETLVQAADTIVVGRIKSGQPYLAGNDDVMTDYYVEVDRVIRRTKSPGLVKGDELVVRRAGGILPLEGHIVRSYERNFPQWAAGESYMLFLAVPRDARTKKERGYYSVVGGPQGVFRLDDAGVRPLMDLHKRWPKNSSIPLATLLGEIQTAVDRPKQ